MTHDEAAAEVAKIKATNDANTASVSESARVTIAEATAKANAAADAVWAQVDKPADPPA
jgi:PIN domain nuclease of toxin-antitoxin system